MIALIDAGPGTGKTFALTYGYLTLSQQLLGVVEPTDEQKVIFKFLTEEFNRYTKVCFFAHNNSTKDNLLARIGKKAKVFTFHGAGQSQIIKRYGHQKLCYDRTESHIEFLTGCNLKQLPSQEKFMWLGVKRLLHYFKLEYMEPTEDNFYYITEKYPDLANYQYPDDWQDKVQKLMKIAAKPDRKIEFGDMIWMGAKCTTKPIYDLGFVDEAQDVSNASYTLVTRMCKNVVFCGDKNQAINAFAGASEEVYDRIKKNSDAVLPLKVTQRCPPTICQMANIVRPGGIIEGPNKRETTHQSITSDEYLKKLKEGPELDPTNTLILARTNAAIISSALSLHNQQIKVQIIDKDLGKEVEKFIKGFWPKSLEGLKNSILGYRTKGLSSRNAMWAQMCADKANAVLQLIDQAQDLKSLNQLIKDTFTKQPGGYKLTTIHKAKGLEADNIIILNPPIELKCAMDHPISREQEINLHFVALTRSSCNLYWVK